MNISRIHFLRQVLSPDQRGGQAPRMQISFANASYLHPAFVTVSHADEEQVRLLYHQLGGGREEGQAVGSTVIIPNRSFWDRLRPITPGEVTVIAAEK